MTGTLFIQEKQTIITKQLQIPIPDMQFLCFRQVPVPFPGGIRHCPVIVPLLSDTFSCGTVTVSFLIPNSQQTWMTCIVV